MNILWSLTHARTCAYQWVKNFSESFSEMDVPLRLFYIMWSFTRGEDFYLTKSESGKDYLISIIASCITRHLLILKENIKANAVLANYLVKS